MRLVVFVEPQQGASYADLLRVAQHAEALGFDAFFRSDHYLVMGDGDGLPGPTDAWATLAGLAVQTTSIRLGTLVSSATFRLPGPLAITVAQVDAMSGGRIELGLGSGWYDDEHSAYGIPFPALGERFDRLEEQLAIVTGLWESPAGETFSHHGHHYDLTDAPALPKPVQRPRPPIIVGGTGRRRTPSLAAAYAEEYNVPFASVEDTGAGFDRVRHACAEAGRDVDGARPIVFSAAQTVACGRTDAQAQRRAEQVGRTPPLFGTPGQVVEEMMRFADLGATRLFLQILDLDDLEHLDVIAEQVAPQLG